MAVESRIFSPRPLLTASELADCAKKWGLELRLLVREGSIPESAPTGPLKGDFVVLAWDARDSQMTAAIDAAYAARDKVAIDEFGKQEKLAWCEFHGLQFNYDKFWADYPEEVEDYESSFKPEKLQQIKSAITKYWLRSSTTPKLCGQLVDGLTRVLVKETAGIKDL